MEVGRADRQQKSDGSKKDSIDEKPTDHHHWMMFELFASCMPFSRKVEQPNPDGPRKSHPSDENCRAGNIASKGRTLSPVASSRRRSSCRITLASLANIGSGVIISSQLREFSYSELKNATRNFRNDAVLGSGGFGRVYKGYVDDVGTASVKPGTGLAVAVKTLNQDGRQGHKEWLAEINFLSKLHHPNLVTLVGFCIDGDDRLLVYEFMARGSLDKHLFRRGHPLPWSVRIKIALDAARGLTYLHEEADTPVIYRDFKASNVLLDADFKAKLSDFGLAKDGPEGDKSHVSTRVMGTYGYAAPEYVRSGHLTSRSDIYSYGIVLLEMLSGRKSVDRQRPTGSQKLLDWALPYLRDKQQYLSVIDPRLGNCFPVTGARKAVQLAARCISPDPRARPLMSEVVSVLKPISEMTNYPHSSPFQHSKSPSNRTKLNAPPSLPPPALPSGATSPAPQSRSPPA